jgi:nucleoside-diphosphate-sugar epimerase
MRIIIVGGAGFVGRNLVRILYKENFLMKDVIIIDKDTTRIKESNKYGVIFIEADLSNYGEWKEFFNEGDIVINLAAQISAETDEPFQANNVEVTKNIIRACKESGIKKIIHFSSAAVISVRKDTYAETKKMGEQLVQDSGLNYVILQPSLMYGPTDDKNIGYLINFARKIPIFPIPGKGKWPRQPVYVDDVCNMLVKIINQFPQQNEIFIINGRDIVFFDDMIKEVHEQLGGFKLRVHLPIIIFKALMVTYQTLTGKKKFTTDQINSLTAGDVFPNYPWWDVFDVKVTSFNEGVAIMLKETPSNNEEKH